MDKFTDRQHSFRCTNICIPRADSQECVSDPLSDSKWLSQLQFLGIDSSFAASALSGGKELSSILSNVIIYHYSAMYHKN